MLRKLTVVMLLCCLMAPFAAFATEGEQDVSLEDALIDAGVIKVTITNDAGEVISEKVVEPVDTSLPRLEPDGSVLLKLTFGGDFTIGDNVQSSGKSIFERELDKEDGDINFLFKNVKDILENDDLTILNFEGTLTTASRNRSRADYSFLFRANPAYAAVLPDNSVEFVTLENNHVLDMGEDGYAETKQVLRDAGVGYACETEPALFTLYGVQVGILAYQTFDGAYDRLFTQVPQDIAALKAQGAELVICAFHWGAELDYYPNNNQQKLAKIAIDGGADLVVGHHSHRINLKQIHLADIGFVLCIGYHKIRRIEPGIHRTVQKLGRSCFGLGKPEQRRQVLRCFAVVDPFADTVKILRPVIPEHYSWKCMRKINGLSAAMKRRGLCMKAHAAMPPW